MTASAAVTAATLGGLSSRRVVFRPEEFSRLVDAALVDEGDDERGTLHVIHAEDVTVPPPRGRPGTTVLVVTVNGEWGAAYFRDRDEAGGFRAAITRNPHVIADAPPLLFDEQAPANFPQDAALPIGQIRTAIEEYLQSGQRPTCVQWQEPDRVMIY